MTAPPTEKQLKEQARALEPACASGTAKFWRPGIPESELRARNRSSAPKRLSTNSRMAEYPGNWGVIVAAASNIAWNIAFALQENGLVTDGYDKALCLDADDAEMISDDGWMHFAEAGGSLVYDSEGKVPLVPDIPADIVEYRPGGGFFSASNLVWKGDAPEEYVSARGGELRHRAWASAFGQVVDGLQKMGMGYLSREDAIAVLGILSGGLLGEGDFPEEPSKVVFHSRDWHCSYECDFPDWEAEYHKALSRATGVVDIWRSFLYASGFAFHSSKDTGRVEVARRAYAAAEQLGLRAQLEAFLVDGIPVEDVIA